ncbi:zinc-ribbon domain-containing protein [bacterium]|nr:zinc-ribbon domain-containing protein [bacterium]
MMCPNCDYKNEEDSRFCERCGARLETAKESVLPIEVTEIEEEETEEKFEEEQGVETPQIMEEIARQPVTEEEKRRMKLLSLISVLICLLLIWLFVKISDNQQKRLEQLEYQKILKTEAREKERHEKELLAQQIEQEERAKQEDERKKQERLEKARREQAELEKKEQERIENEKAEKAREAQEEKKRAERERDKIASTPIRIFDLGLKEPCQGGICSVLGSPQQFEGKFVDRYGYSHTFKILVVEQSKRMVWVRWYYPIYTMKVDDKEISRNMEGCGYWLERCVIRIDPLMCVFEPIGIRYVRTNSVKLYRTDYGLPSQ